MANTAYQKILFSLLKDIPKLPGHRFTIHVLAQSCFGNWLALLLEDKQKEYIFFSMWNKTASFCLNKQNTLCFAAEIRHLEVQGLCIRETLLAIPVFMYTKALFHFENFPFSDCLQLGAVSILLYKGCCMTMGVVWLMLDATRSEFSVSSVILCTCLCVYFVFKRVCWFAY